MEKQASGKSVKQKAVVHKRFVVSNGTTTGPEGF